MATQPETAELVQLDDLAYSIATTYGSKDYDGIWEAAVVFDNRRLEPPEGLENLYWLDEKAQLRLACTSLWTLAYYPTRHRKQLDGESKPQSWLRASGDVFIAPITETEHESLSELAELAKRGRYRTARANTIYRVRGVLELLNLSLSSQA